MFSAATARSVRMATWSPVISTSPSPTARNRSWPFLRTTLAAEPAPFVASSGLSVRADEFAGMRLDSSSRAKAAPGLAKHGAQEQQCRRMFHSQFLRDHCELPSCAQLLPCPTSAKSARAISTAERVATEEPEATADD